MTHTEFKLDKSNLFILRQDLETSIVRSSYIVLSSGRSKQELFESLNPELLENKHTWLVEGEEREFESLYFPVDSQVYIFSNRNDRILINEIYKIDAELPQLSLRFGGWSPEALFVTKQSIFERRKNMYGYKFRSTMGIELPYQGPKVEKDGKVLEIEGILGEVWHEGIEKTMNFTTTFTYSVDGYWGTKDSNGQWNGMIGEISRNETDMGITAFFVTFDRSQVVDFSPTFSKRIYFECLSASLQRFRRVD